MKEQSKQTNVEFNHHILLARDKQKTTEFLTQLLDLPEATPADGPVPGFFLCIHFKNDVTLLIAEAKEHPMGHYAFKIPQEDFERVLQRLRDWSIDYWADPCRQRPSECYEENGNRGLYCIDPSGHGMEVFTQLNKQ